MPAPLPADDDPIVRALDVLGSRGAFLVMREAYYGTRRFDDFARRLAMSPSALSSRLRELVADGMLARAPYREAGTRTRSEYVLTPKGEALLPALVALQRWANDHLPPVGPRVDLVHAACGAPVGAQVVCDDGHRTSLADLARRVAEPGEDQRVAATSTPSLGR
jgi:DNA-binding HxlR family transcriptional regulator